MTVNDERDDERVDDGDHEELGRDEVVGEFPEKKSRVRIQQKANVNGPGTRTHDKPIIRQPCLLLHHSAIHPY